MGLPLVICYSPIYVEPKPSPIRFLVLCVVVCENHVVNANFVLEVWTFVSLELKTSCMISACRA